MTSTGPELVALTRRDRKRLATRDTIRHAALELFVERGFDEVTVEQVASRADVAPSTFFRHFETKEDVVLHDYPQRALDLFHAFEVLPDHLAPMEAVVGALAGWESTRRDPDVLRAEARIVADTPRVAARLSRILESWERPVARQLRRFFPATAEPLEADLLAAWTIATVRVVITHWYRSGADADLFAAGRDALLALSRDMGALASIDLVGAPAPDHGSGRAK